MGFPTITSVTSVEGADGSDGVCLELVVDGDIDAVLERVLKEATTPMSVVKLDGEAQTLRVTVFDREHIPAALNWLLAAGLENMAAEADVVRATDAAWLESAQKLIDSYSP
jgi:hypothetical protein